MNGKQIKIPLVLLISLSFTALLLTTGTIVGLVNYSGMKKMLFSSTGELIKRSGESTLSELSHIYAPVEGTVKSLSVHPITNTTTTQERLEFLPYLKTTLESASALSAIYLGFEDGSFFLLRNISPTYKPSFQVPEKSKYLVQSIEIIQGKAPNILFYFYDENLSEISSFIPENYEYDPRTRDWYTNAISNKTLIHTEPYIFFTTKEVGKTIAILTNNEHGVIGADVTLSALSDLLIKQKITQSTQIALIDREKNVIAYTDPAKLVLNSEDNKLKLAHLKEIGSPVLKILDKDFTPGDTSESKTITYINESWISYSTKLSNTGTETVYLILISPEDELLSDAKDNLTKTLLITLLILFVSLPIVFFVSHAISKSMSNLTGYTRAIQNFDFRGGLPEKSKIFELNELSQTVGLMKNTIQKFLDISAILTAEKDFEKLMKYIISETSSACGMPAAVLYTVSLDESLLEVGAIYLSDGSAVAMESLPSISLSEESTTFPIHQIIKNNKISVLPIPRIAFINELSFFGQERENDFPFLIGIPLKNQDKQFIGVLCLFNLYDISQNSSLLSFIENLSGTTSVAIENHRILESQKNLFDSFLKTLAAAIDSKSSYSIEHCTRVPEIAILLADAVSSQEGDGMLSNFTLSPEEKEAFKIAAYLHDIGKIKTPEYIVEKSTRLESITNRIHEVRLRFEILKRDLMISYYKKQQEGVSPDQLLKDLDRESKLLDEEFQFVANCNEGVVEMTPETLDRIKKISLKSFEKTLDDTMGISIEEKQKKMKKKKSTSNQEFLLSDKPEHIIEHTESEKITYEQSKGFYLKVPRYKLNYGEIHNLSTTRGVHTEEELFVINSHILDSIRILNSLPFTGTLKSVPEIAGGHHERMDGSGFPKKLQKDDMSIQARILNFAEIFETITSIPNPYKKGKTISQILDELESLKRKNLIDGDLLEIFLSSGVFMEFAKKYMQPYQIDKIDISKYLTKN